MIERIIRRVLEAAALTAFIPSLVCAEPYKPSEISDLTTIEIYDGTLSLGGKDISYTLSRQSDISDYNERSHSRENIRHVISDSYTLIKSYLSERGFSYKECREDYNLHIFIVDKSVLYTPSRFGKYWASTGNPHNTLWAYYDSTLEIEKNSIILLANIYGENNDALFAHEMSHYWYDRLCLGTQLSGGSEKFAQSYQSYYERNRPER